MSSFTRRYVDLRCDGCGKETALFARDAPDARKKAGSWKFGKKEKGKGHGVFDACPSCQLPEGYRQA